MLFDKQMTKKMNGKKEGKKKQLINKMPRNERVFAYLLYVCFQSIFTILFFFYNTIYKSRTFRETYQIKKNNSKIILFNKMKTKTKKPKSINLFLIFFFSSHSYKSDKKLIRKKINSFFLRLFSSSFFFSFSTLLSDYYK